MNHPFGLTTSVQGFGKRMRMEIYFDGGCVCTSSGGVLRYIKTARWKGKGAKVLNDGHKRHFDYYLGLLST